MRSAPTSPGGRPVSSAISRVSGLAQSRPWHGPMPQRVSALTRFGPPGIFNTDQGAQFTSQEWLARLQQQGILISMDGRGRALDNVFVERLWRTVKYEDIYLRDYQTVPDLETGLTDYFQFYNEERPHSALDHRTPAEVHWTSQPDP